MKQNKQSILAMSLFFMLATTGNAETSTNAAPPATPHKAMGMDMQPGMGMGGMGMHHGMGGMGGMMAGMTEAQKDQHLRGMQEHMLKMHDLSNQILAEKDVTKKEQLKTQQLQLMKEHHAEMKDKRKEMREMRKK